MLSKKISFWVVLAIIVFVLLGCGLTTSDQISNAAKESTQTPASGETAPQASKNVSSETPTVKPTIAEPTATEPSKPTAKDLILSEDFNFIQDTIEVLPVFTVENPNENYAIEQAEYEVALFDAAGTVLESDSGYIDVLMPGEKTSIVASLYVEEGQIVDKITVQLNQGSAVWMDEPVTIFSVERPMFFPDENFPRVTGIIKNGLNRDLTTLRLSAVAFDEAGVVVGAGYTYISFVPASGQTGVSLSLAAVKGTVASVELYPMLSGLSSLDQPESAAHPLTITKTGFGLDSSQVGFGYILSNSDAKNSVEGTQVRAIGYDDQGNVLVAEEASIEVIMPQETLGSYVEAFVPENTQIITMEIQILPGDVTPIDVTGSIFKTDQVAFLPDQYFPKSSGVIINGLNKNIERFRVNTIAYNANGDIIGGGYTYVDFLPPSGQAPVDMSLVIGENPAKVEIYPTLSGLSALENIDLAGSPIQLVTYGYSQSSSMVAIGFLVKNSDAANVYGGSQYQVAAYDEAGKVLGTTSGYLGDIYPSSQTGEIAELSVPENTTVTRVEVQINPGSPDTPLLSQNPFTFDTITFQPDTYFSKVTGIIKNAADKQVTNVHVTAIAYDASGAIIGGGYTYVDFVLAAGQTAVDMSVNVTGTPVSWEMFGEITSLSELK